MKTNILIAFLVLLVCSRMAFSEEPVKKVFKAAVDADGIQRVTVTGGEFFFDPSFIIVKVNVPVELSVKKESGMVPHNIVIKAPDAGIDVEEDISTYSKIIRFTPGKTGQFPITCEKKFLFFKSHKEKGMEGVLEVTE